MATTTNYALEKPTVGGDTDTWGGKLNDNMDAIDAQMKTNADAVAALGDPVAVAKGGTGSTTAAAARTALGLGTAATQADTKYAHRANNLSDLNNVASARANLGVVEQSVETISLEGSFSGTNNFRLVKIGRQVIAQTTVDNLSHASNSGPISAANIPPAYRPANNVSSVVDMGIGRISRVTVLPGGNLIAEHRDFSGSGVLRTSIGGFAMSWLTAS
jgi:hypothetical protein